MFNRFFYDQRIFSKKRYLIFFLSLKRAGQRAKKVYIYDGRRIIKGQKALDNR